MTGRVFLPGMFLGNNARPHFAPLESCSALPDALTDSALQDGGSQESPSSLMTSRPSAASDVTAFGCLVQEVLRFEQPAVAAAAGCEASGAIDADSGRKWAAAASGMPTIDDEDSVAFSEPSCGAQSCLLARRAAERAAHAAKLESADLADALLQGAAAVPTTESEALLTAPEAIPITLALLVLACQARAEEERPTFDQVFAVLEDIEHELASGWYRDVHGQLRVRRHLSIVICGCFLWCERDGSVVERLLAHAKASPVEHSRNSCGACIQPASRLTGQSPVPRVETGYHVMQPATYGHPGDLEPLSPPSSADGASPRPTAHVPPPASLPLPQQRSRSLSDSMPQHALYAEKPPAPEPPATPSPSTGSIESAVALPAPRSHEAASEGSTLALEATLNSAAHAHSFAASAELSRVMATTSTARPSNPCQLASSSALRMSGDLSAERPRLSLGMLAGGESDASAETPRNINEGRTSLDGSSMSLTTLTAQRMRAVPPMLGARWPPARTESHASSISGISGISSSVDLPATWHAAVPTGLAPVPPLTAASSSSLLDVSQHGSTIISGGGQSARAESSDRGTGTVGGSSVVSETPSPRDMPSHSTIDPPHSEPPTFMLPRPPIETMAASSSFTAPSSPPRHIMQPRGAALAGRPPRPRSPAAAAVKVAAARQPRRASTAGSSPPAASPRGDSGDESTSDALSRSSSQDVPEVLGRRVAPPPGSGLVSLRPPPPPRKVRAYLHASATLPSVPESMSEVPLSPTAPRSQLPEPPQDEAGSSAEPAADASVRVAVREKQAPDALSSKASRAASKPISVPEAVEAPRKRAASAAAQGSTQSESEGTNPEGTSPLETGRAAQPASSELSRRSHSRAASGQSLRVASATSISDGVGMSHEHVLWDGAV